MQILSNYMKKNPVSLIMRGRQIRTIVRYAGRLCLLSNPAAIFMRSAMPTRNSSSQTDTGASLEKEAVGNIPGFSLDIPPLLPTICVNGTWGSVGMCILGKTRGKQTWERVWEDMGCWVRTLYSRCFGVTHAPVSIHALQVSPVNWFSIKNCGGIWRL